MNGHIRITYLSVDSTPPDVLKKSSSEIKELINVEIVFSGYTSTECDEDPLRYQELCKNTLESDCVIISCMGDPWRFRRFDSYSEVLKKSGALVTPISGNLEVDMMTRYLFSGTDKEFMSVERYSIYKSPQNDISIFWWIARHLGYTDLDPPEPESYPDHVLYRHGALSPDDTKKHFSNMSEDKITVGLMFTLSQMAYGNSGYIDAIVDCLENMGMQAIPVACSFECMRAAGGTENIFETYFCRDGKPTIDVLISETGYANINRADGVIPEIDEESCFRRLVDVPVIFGLAIHGQYHDFEQEKIGIKRSEFGSNVIYPELDGNVVSVPISYTTKETGKEPIPIYERIDHLCRLAKAWGSLRRKPVGERKVAIMMWQSRPNSGMIGGASGLDTIESISDLLKKLNSEGYHVDGVPENGKELISEILENVTNDLDNSPIEYVRSKAADLVSKKDYGGQYERISKWDRTMTEASWGPPVGEIMTDRDRIIVPGLLKGNVFVCYQPMRGWAEHMEQNTHDPLLFTQHQYNGYYWWIKHVFKADMIFHIGTHGTLEWLPGVNVGMSCKCNPDYVLDAVPNIYAYTINDPGEGVQCKRRIESVLIGHMPPALARADGYDYLDEVEVQLQDYFKFRFDSSEDMRKGMVSQIFEAAKKHNLLKDLGIDEETFKPDDFEEYIIPLHEYLSEVEDTFVRSDLHILGRAPRLQHYDEMIYTLMRLDNGDIRSLRDTFASNAGYDIGELIENPSYMDENGLLNSEKLKSIDSSLRKFIERLHREYNFDTESGIRDIMEHYGNVDEDLRNSVAYMCEKLVPNINRMSYEVDHMMDGLDGRYVIPGPSGAPERGNADILPMGRNFYSLDPETVPTKTSWEIGRNLAEQMIQRFVKDHGSYPKEIGIVVWATDMMKTGGDDAAYILWLLGIEPVWSSHGGQVVDLKVIPVSELGRPRVDVTLNITGLFRDTFPATIELLDEAIKIVANLDESDEENALAANLRHDIIEDISKGISPDLARKNNSIRIFGEALGTYGNGVGNLIENSMWERTSDLADIYADFSSYAYAKGDFGRQLKDHFIRRFSKVEATIKNVPSRGIDILDIDDVYQYLGGMNAFVRTYGNQNATTYIGDNSDPKNTKVRSTQEELRFLFRAKVMNPKFNNGLMEHGYRGASEMAKITEYTMAWDATSDIVEDWMYNALADGYLFDKDIHEWMNEVNPYATMNILNTLQEAIGRGMWDASEEYLNKLKEMFIEMEEMIEEMTDRK